MSGGYDIPLDDGVGFEEWYQGLTVEERLRWSNLSANQPRWSLNSGTQEQAFYSKADILGFGGAAGGPLTLDSEIKTAFGSVRMGDIDVGAWVCNAYGSLTEVVGIRDCGMSEVYEVRFSDDTVVRCGKDHLWYVWSRNKPKKERGARTFGKDSGRVYPLSRIMDDMERGVKYRIPICGGVVGNYNRYKISGYGLGVFLGDGHLPLTRNCRVVCHRDDVEILNILSDEMDGITISGKNTDNCLVGCLSKKSVDYARLRDLGMLGLKSYEKRLPKQALVSNIRWRTSLLQGLMDTDGCVSEKRCAYYCTTSPHLRDGVSELARSLGCYVTITDSIPIYPYKGEKRVGRRAYVLRIKSPNPVSLFRLKRKKEIASRLSHQSMGKDIVSVTRVSDEPIKCITVSCPSGLFLTNNYTVTHNSKSALLILLAMYSHRRTILYRYESTQMRGMIDDMVECVGHQEGLTRQGKRWYVPGEERKLIEWSGLADEKAMMAQRGIAHDFIGFDEVTEIQESRVRFVTTWLRSAVEGQRTRVVMTFNPPSTSEGRWVIDYFAPWLDEKHENPAKSGELRWYVSDENGKDKEVADSTPISMQVGSEVMDVYPKSRTFIPSLVHDNPFLTHDTNYISTLQSLEEPFRSQMLLGDFRSGLVDDDWQIIPTKWIDEAMGRWAIDGRKKRMSALGLDPARGGKDFTVIARRHGYWWDEMVRRSGSETPDGSVVAGMVMSNVRDGAKIIMDNMSIGASPYDLLKESGLSLRGVPAQGKSMGKPCGSQWEFYNLRAEMWWRLRSVLNPENNFQPALPKDNRLRAELISVRWQLKGGRVLVESKDSIRSKLGRSTDDADAVCLSLMNMDRDGSNDGRWRGRKKASRDDYSGSDEDIGYDSDSNNSTWMRF